MSVILKAEKVDGRIAVYSCVVGKYDRIIEPVYVQPGVDYLMFTDLDLPKIQHGKNRYN